MKQLADILESQLAEETDPASQKRIKEYIIMCRAPEVAVAKLLQYLSWASFILLPLFALILKLFYVRQKQLYIRHLLFSIHVHSFLFMILICIVLPKLIFNSIPEIVTMILIGTIPIYLISALHNFYGQSWQKTIAKFFGIGFMHNIILVTVVLLVFLKSLQVF